MKISEGADLIGYCCRGDTSGEVSCMQVIPFHWVFLISNEVLFGDDVKTFVSGFIKMGI